MALTLRILVLWLTRKRIESDWRSLEEGKDQRSAGVWWSIISWINKYIIPDLINMTSAYDSFGGRFCSSFEQHRLLDSLSLSLSLQPWWWTYSSRLVLQHTRIGFVIGRWSGREAFLIFLCGTGVCSSSPSATWCLSRSYWEQSTLSSRSSFSSDLLLLSLPTLLSLLSSSGLSCSLFPMSSSLNFLVL